MGVGWCFGYGTVAIEAGALCLRKAVGEWGLGNRRASGRTGGREVMREGVEIMNEEI
jgi:hypothetical protein